ncbi:type II toxin-antitoxin system death-on-curing family toxin [Demequina sp. SYSU T00192]|uniref:Type II toxin-antitoxin system death-on-curing family toxin n=1 Tax=Demequina litoralis TaxID=3051660 RepID=A0ABT8GCU0_9MICO|nr:type II toxin-antitoxin system death-on-curing family toxin [Demequina sp. SYSU T00192]MDN4476948.1 type II toxin-antitoxin system death-on-curing family toxin [Demequina sp. SYSU T00192]
MTDYIELDELLEMVRVAGLGPVRDVGLLESALARPATTLMGADAYPTLELKAAALLHSLVNNHALADGNKRLGWLATVVFVGFNGFRVRMSQGEAFDLVWAVADGTLDDVGAIAARLRLESRG